MNKIWLNIEKAEQEGRGMGETKAKLQQYLTGDKKSDNIKLFNSYYAEAAGEIGLMKLPKGFRKYQDFIEKGLRNNISELVGEDADKVRS